MINFSFWWERSPSRENQELSNLCAICKCSLYHELKKRERLKEVLNANGADSDDSTDLLSKKATLWLRSSDSIYEFVYT